MKNAQIGRTSLYPTIRTLMFVLLGVVLFSCGKDESADPEELKGEVGNLPGLGRNGGTPQGTAFTLPDGVTLVDDITGGYCEDATFRIGSGHHVTVCVGLHNDTDQKKTVTFPAGLVLISKTDDYQNGVVLTHESFDIPPKQTVRFIFHTYCGNASRSGASSSAVYTFGPITSSKLITRLINDLESKKIAAVDYLDDEEWNDEYDRIASTVQGLLWMITDGADHGVEWPTFELMYQQQLGLLPNK